MRYGVSGANKFVIGPATQYADSGTQGGAFCFVHGTATSTLSSRGVTFWLRSMWAFPNASGYVVGIADASVGATEMGNAAIRSKFRMAVASFAPVTASNNGGVSLGVAKVDFPAPGIKFSTNCVAYLIAGSGATGGQIGGCGYEE